MTVVLVFGALLALLLAGIPIFAALGLTAAGILMLFEGSLSSAADTVFAHLNKPILTTIPLFVLMAQIMIRAKVIDDLFDFAHTAVGHIKGGLGVATVLACTIFAAISGSSVATALSVGSSALPQMKRFGYRERDRCDGNAVQPSAAAGAPYRAGGRKMGRGSGGCVRRRTGCADLRRRQSGRSS